MYCVSGPGIKLYQNVTARPYDFIAMTKTWTPIIVSDGETLLWCVGIHDTVVPGYFMVCFCVLRTAYMLCLYWFSLRHCIRALMHCWPANLVSPLKVRLLIVHFFQLSQTKLP